jgi:hypothetical protein
VTEGKAGREPLDFIKQVAALPCNTMFRHNVAGDLWPQKDHSDMIDAKLLHRLIMATSHLSAAWTYTHHTLTGITGEWNQIVIKESNQKEFIVNISTESLDEAAKYHKLGFFVTVVQPEGKLTAFRHDGVQFVQCPATLPNSDVTCVTCGGRYNKPLCARERNVVVVFPAHGTKKKAAASHCS